MGGKATAVSHQRGISEGSAASADPGEVVRIEHFKLGTSLVRGKKHRLLVVHKK